LGTVFHVRNGPGPFLSIRDMLFPVKISFFEVQSHFVSVDAVFWVAPPAISRFCRFPLAPFREVRDFLVDNLPIRPLPGEMDGGVSLLLLSISLRCLFLSSHRLLTRMCRPFLAGCSRLFGRRPGERALTPSGPRQNLA